VVFSDSREDAAQLSNGVERNHYSDLLRESLVHELWMLAFGEPQLLEDIERNNSIYGGLAQKYLNENPSANNTIKDDLELAKIDLEHAKMDVPQALPAAAQAVLKQQIIESRERIESIRQRGILHVVHVRRSYPSVWR